MDQWPRLNRTSRPDTARSLEPAGAGDRPTRKGLPLSPNSDLQVRSQKGLQHHQSTVFGAGGAPALGGKRPLRLLVQVPRDAPGHAHPQVCSSRSISSRVDLW